MGKQAGASSEELEFIFGCFKRGLSDKDVLDEMESQEMLKRNVRYIRERRRHWEAAKKVIEGEVSTDYNPIVRNQRKEHFDYLVTIAQHLLAGGLDSVFPNKRSSGYTIGNPELEAELPGEEFGGQLMKNFDSACVKFGNFDMECFFYHLMHDKPDFQITDRDSFLDSDWYELLGALRVMVRRKTFKGKCPICNDW